MIMAYNVVQGLTFNINMNIKMNIAQPIKITIYIFVC